MFPSKFNSCSSFWEGSNIFYPITIPSFWCFGCSGGEDQNWYNEGDTKAHLHRVVLKQFILFPQQHQHQCWYWDWIFTTWHFHTFCPYWCTHWCAGYSGYSYKGSRDGYKGVYGGDTDSYGAYGYESYGAYEGYGTGNSLDLRWSWCWTKDPRNTWFHHVSSGCTSLYRWNLKISKDDVHPEQVKIDQSSNWSLGLHHWTKVMVELSISLELHLWLGSFFFPILVIWQDGRKEWPGSIFFIVKCEEKYVNIDTYGTLWLWAVSGQNGGTDMTTRKELRCWQQSRRILEIGASIILRFIVFSIEGLFKGGFGIQKIKPSDFWLLSRRCRKRSWGRSFRTEKPPAEKPELVPFEPQEYGTTTRFWLFRLPAFRPKGGEMWRIFQWKPHLLASGFQIQHLWTSLNC